MTKTQTELRAEIRRNVYARIAGQRRSAKMNGAAPASKIAGNGAAPIAGKKVLLSRCAADIAPVSNAELDRLALETDARQGERMMRAVYGFLGRFVAYPSEHARVAHAL